MKIQSVAQTGVGVTGPIAFDIMRNPFNVGIGCVVTGTVTYTIQHTFDDTSVDGYNPATGNWFNHDDSALVNATANANSNYAYPVTASRIDVTAGTGTVTVNYIQAGLFGGG